MNRPPLDEDPIHFFEPVSRPAVGWYFTALEAGWVGPFATEDEARQAHHDYEEAEIGECILMRGLKLNADS